MGGDSGHPPCTCAGQGGGGGRVDLAGKISRPTVAGRARIRLANAAAATMVGHRIFLFSGHSRPTHIFLPPLLNPLNSFLWSFFIDSSPFERYDENKFGRRLDRVCHHSNCWTKVRVLLCSWSLGLSVDIKFVNFGLRLVSFPFLGHFG